MLAQPSPPTDAPADAERHEDTQLQEAGSTCEQYCQCMRGMCAQQMPAAVSCLDLCAMLSASERDCRVGVCSMISNGQGTPMLDVCGVVSARADTCSQSALTSDAGR